MSTPSPLCACPRKAARPGLLVAAAVILAAVVPVSAQQASGFTADQYWLLPLRVHLMRSDTVPALHTKLTEADTRRILGKVNGIWRQAGIAFFPESVIAEQAAGIPLVEGMGERRSERHLRLIRPAASRSDRLFHVYYLGEMSPNGICFQRSPELIFVKETARLHPVRGGIDEPLPRVTAHEIGHALGLDHRQDTFNLMASGTSGTSLNEAEIATSRAVAEKLEWKVTPATALQRASGAPKERASRSLLDVLSLLPDGPLSMEAKKLAGSADVQ